MTFYVAYREGEGTSALTLTATTPCRAVANA